MNDEPKETTMAPAEQDQITKTTRLPLLERTSPPRPAWPFVVAAVAAAVVVAAVGLAVLGDDGPGVRTGAVGTSSPTTVANAPTTEVTTATTAPTATTAAQRPSPTPTQRPKAGSPTSTQPPGRVFDTARLSLDGIGPVDVGMTLTEASAAAGTPIRIAPGTDLGAGCAYARADNGPDDLLFMVVDGRIVRVDIGHMGPDRIVTVSGIGKGSTEDEVKRTYPGRISVQGHPYVPSGHYLIYTPADPNLGHLRMLFETDGHVVTTFRAGLAGPVSWTEGCA